MPGGVRERPARSAAKILGWHAIATSTTITISYLYLQDLTVASEIGAIDLGIKLLLHYAYERGFSRLEWGLEPADPPSA